MFVCKLQAWTENEANELIKNNDKNGDGVHTKGELQSFLIDVRGSTQLNSTIEDLYLRSQKQTIMLRTSLAQLLI